MKQTLVVLVFAGTFLTPGIAQTTLNMSEDLIRLGVASGNMAPNQPTLDAGPLFMQALRFAQVNGFSRVIADPGSYYFLAAQPGSCYLTPILQNITVDLQSSDLYFADLTAGSICFHGTNATLQNFTIDYLTLPFTQLEVTSVNATEKQVEVSVPSGWQKPSALTPLLTGFTSAFIFRNGEPWPLSDRMAVQQPLADDHLTFTEATSSVIAQIRPGDVAVVTPVNNYTVGISVSGSGCTLRNIRIYASLEAPWFVRGDTMLFERVYVMPRPGTDRLIGGGGPVVQFTGPNNTLRLNRAIRQVDEGFGLGVSFYGSVQSVLASRSLQVQGGAVGSASGNDTLAQNRTMPNGTPVEFQRLSDGAILGGATVVSHSTAPAINGLPQAILNFDSDLPTGLEGSYVYPIDPDQRGGNTLFERNAVEHEVYGVAIDPGGFMNSVFHGNYVQRSSWAGINSGFPGANPPSRNITISNNVIDEANSYLGGAWPGGDMFASLVSFGAIQIADFTPTGSLSTASPLENINITNNFVADPGRTAVWMGNTSGGSVAANVFMKPGNNPELNLAYPPEIGRLQQPLVVDTSLNIAVGSNAIDTSSGRVWISDTQFRELASYAPDEMIRLNAYALGKSPLASVMFTDADGGVTVLPIQSSTQNSLDVLIPASAALGGAWLTLASADGRSNKSDFGTLFVDSQDNIPAVNGCTYEVSPSSSSVQAGAASLPILVVTQAGCSYQVLTTDSFVTSSSSGSGTAMILVNFTANEGLSRTATIEIAGKPFTFTQAPPRPQRSPRRP